jgi:hypothetical protein
MSGSQKQVLQSIVEEEKSQENYYEVSEQRVEDSNDKNTRDNIQYGNTPTTISSNILRVYHQNIKGSKVYKNWNKWKEGTEWLNHNGIGIATIVEAITKWNDTNIREVIHNTKQYTKK